MRAVVHFEYGGPDVVRIGNLPVPECGATECLIEVRAASVNPADWKYVAGSWKFATGNRFPRKIGTDFSGVVREAGPRVTRFEKGDAVMGCVHPMHNGSFAEYTAVSESGLSRKPANLSFQEAAGIPVACSTAYMGLRHGREDLIGKGVLITGAGGGVGHFAVQLAKMWGAGVTAVCSGGKIDFCAALGADTAVDYRVTDIYELKDRYDVIVDCASSLVYPRVKKILIPGGEYLLLSLRGKLIYFAYSFLSQLTPGKKMWTFLARPESERYERLAELFEQEKIKVTIDSIFSMERAVDALKKCRDGHARGKIIVEI